MCPQKFKVWLKSERKKIIFPRGCTAGRSILTALGGSVGGNWRRILPVKYLSSETTTPQYGSAGRATAGAKTGTATLQADGRNYHLVTTLLLPALVV